MSKPKQGTRHRWPDTMPPCRTSEPQRCLDCGLERSAHQVKARYGHGVTWAWEYTRVVPDWLRDPKKLTVQKTTEAGPCEPRKKAA